MIAPRRVRTKWQARYRDADGTIRSAGMFSTQTKAYNATVVAMAEVITQEAIATPDEPPEEPEELPTEPKAPKVEKVHLTLAEYAPRAMTILESTCQPGTMANHERNLRLHILPTFGHLRLKDIRPDDVDTWWAERPATGWRKAAYFTLSRIMRLARKHGHVKVNPCQTEGASTDVSTSRPELTEVEAWRIIDKLDPDMKAFFVVLFGGSLRIGEALGLDRGHLDLDTGKLVVEQQFRYQKGGEVIAKRTKTGAPRDTVLPPWALEEVRAYLHRHPSKIAYAPMFTNTNGERLSRRRVYTALDRACVDAGLPWVHVHDFRHTSLTSAMLSSGDLFATMARAGHGDVRSAKRYQHVGDDRQREVALNWVRKMS